jgi:hypothetical protein
VKPKGSPKRSTRGNVVASMYQAIDYFSAILLLTGQVTSTGVFISPGGMWLSITGPIIGGKRLSGTGLASGIALDTVDIVAAILLILGQLTVTGPWITTASFNLVISGPAFGVNTVPVPATPREIKDDFYKQYRSMLVTRFLHEET